MTDHRLTEAEWTPSAHAEPRPPWARPELVVIHCISLPENQFGTGAPERLFLGELDPSEHPSFADLAGVRVAPHLFINRAGHVRQFVSFDRQAWHAGVSQWCGRDGCNAYSIGIELEGSVSTPYTTAQYHALGGVLKALLAAYPGLHVGAIVGHSEIAPDRKQDPGKHFDWAGLLLSLGRPSA